MSMCQWLLRIIVVGCWFMRNKFVLFCVHNWSSRMFMCNVSRYESLKTMWTADISVISHCFVVIYRGRAQKHTLEPKKTPSTKCTQMKWDWLDGSKSVRMYKQNGNNNRKYCSRSPWTTECASFYDASHFWIALNAYFLHIKHTRKQWTTTQNKLSTHSRPQ